MKAIIKQGDGRHYYKHFKGKKAIEEAQRALMATYPKLGQNDKQQILEDLKKTDPKKFMDGADGADIHC